MKMPSFSELDEEQLRVYQGAPPDGSVLVVGPPGTGKTIMAFHRARTLKELGRSPQVIMYNSVLRSFSSNGHDTAEDVDVDTMHKWLDKWFRTMRAGRPPQTAPWVTDWPAVGTKVQEVLKNGGAESANWGHLIVDEGQDFPKDMYSVLSFLTHAHKWKGAAPAITVFADENQRLNEKHNSCISDLKAAMSLSAGNRIYKLSRNYRNTKQVAEFASHFYCGMSTGNPDLPRKKGPLPIVHFVKNVSEIAATIADWVVDAPPQEVGVICSRDRDRKRVFSVLQDKLVDYEETAVQTYKSGDPEFGKAEGLTFDEKGYVTVLNYQSVKGLEFDTVFIVDPFLATPPAGAGVQQFKMNMYVMCSRARTNLRLLFATPSRDRPTTPSAAGNVQGGPVNMTPSQEERAESASELRQPDTSKRGRTKRKKGAAIPPAGSKRFLLPVWDVDAIRYLCGGVMYAPQGCEVRHVNERQLVRVWPTRVPATAISDVLRGREFGGALLLELDVSHAPEEKELAEDFIAMPASISRLARILARTQEERDVFIARVRAYPDVPLDAVEFAVRGEAFAAPEEEEPALDLRSVEQPALADRFGGVDKALGAVAGLVAGLRGSAWDPGFLSRLLEGITAPIESAHSLVGSIAALLEPEDGDSLGPAFAQALARHLSATSPKEGFEPDSLLNAVAEELRLAVSDKDYAKLDKFVTTASAVIDGTISAGRNLLADDGTIGMRAGLLVLRVQGDPDQLSAMCRGPNLVGERVRALAWTLLGCFRGCASLPNAFKAEPRELLLGLGDVAEMIWDGAAGAITGSEMRSPAGRKGWTLKLAGREVLNLRVTGQDEVEPILALAERNAWVNQGEGDVLVYRIAVADRAPIAFSFSAVSGAALIPREPLIRVSARASRPARGLPGGKAMERIFDAGNVNKVHVHGVRSAAGWQVDFVAYLAFHGNKVDAVHQALSSVAAAVDASAQTQVAETRSGDSEPVG